MARRNRTTRTAQTGKPRHPSVYDQRLAEMNMRRIGYVHQAGVR